MKSEVERLGWMTPVRKTRRANDVGGRPFSRGHLYRILSNPIYIGQIAHKGEVFAGQHSAIVDAALWQAVQDKLKDNLKGHRMRVTAANPSLLTGLVLDDQGHRLTPTHTKKGERRYRYYVSQPLLATGREVVPNALRWPAQELEDAVLQALARFLTDESRWVELMGAIEADVVHSWLQHAADLARQLSVTKSAQKIEILQRIVRQIKVHPRKLEIVLYQNAVWASRDEPVIDEPMTVIEVPIELKRCGMAMRLIVHAPGEAAIRKPDPKLVARIAKGHEWFARLASGGYDSVQAIARKEQVTSSYVARVIYLAFLAPDIVQRIIRGDHPMDLNADRLIRMVPLPMAWDEQRMLLGMNN